MQWGLFYVCQEELERLRSSATLHPVVVERPPSMGTEAAKYKDLYENELKLRERLTARLEKANEKATKASL